MMVSVFVLKTFNSNKRAYKDIGLDVGSVMQKFEKCYKKEPGTAVIALNLLSEVLHVDPVQSKLIIDKF